MKIESLNAEAIKLAGYIQAPSWDFIKFGSNKLEYFCKINHRDFPRYHLVRDRGGYYLHLDERRLHGGVFGGVATKGFIVEAEATRLEIFKKVDLINKNKAQLKELVNQYKTMIKKVSLKQGQLTLKT